MNHLPTCNAAGGGYIHGGILAEQRDVNVLWILGLGGTGDESVTGRILLELKKRLKPYLNRFGRRYVCQAYDLAVLSICIVLEKDKEPVLSCELMTYLFQISSNQWTKIKLQVDELCLNDGFLENLSVEAIVYEEIEKDENADGF